jgi:hypothetical protein
MTHKYRETYFMFAVLDVLFEGWRFFGCPSWRPRDK